MACVTELYDCRCYKLPIRQESAALTERGPALCDCFYSSFSFYNETPNTKTSLAILDTVNLMSSRNKLITTLLICLLLVAIVILALGVLRQQEMNDTSRQSAIEFTQQILSRNPQTQVANAAVLIDNAHPILLERQSNADLTGYIDLVFRTHGELQVVENIAGGSQSPLLPNNSESPTAAYSLDAVFGNGPSRIDISLVFEQGRWQIEDFRVESNLMVL